MAIMPLPKYDQKMEMLRLHQIRAFNEQEIAYGTYLPASRVSSAICAAASEPSC